IGASKKKRRLRIGIQHHPFQNAMTPPRCPVYGFRWPARNLNLVAVGGNECGLDLDINGPCQMELAGRAADFSRCETAFAANNFLSIASHRIRFFPSNEGEGVGLVAWTN